MTEGKGRGGEKEGYWVSPTKRQESLSQFKYKQEERVSKSERDIKGKDWEKKETPVLPFFAKGKKRT